LRKAIYHGNENYPWFSRKPAWERLHDNEYFAKTMVDLARTYRSNVRRWRRLLATAAE
jgi:serine/threonine-protein kinase